VSLSSLERYLYWSGGHAERIAERLERKLSGAITEDLAAAEVGTVCSARGTGTSVASELAGILHAVLHTRVQPPDAGRVERARLWPFQGPALLTVGELAGNDRLCGRNQRIDVVRLQPEISGESDQHSRLVHNCSAFRHSRCALDIVEGRGQENDGVIQRGRVVVNPKDGRQEGPNAGKWVRLRAEPQNREITEE
jgi:hypothetical protein